MEQVSVMNQELNDTEFDFFDFLSYLLRRIKFVLIAAAVGLLIAALYAFVIATPMYEATAQLYVVSSSDSVVNLSDFQIGSYLASDYQLVFDTWEVNQMVINNLKLPYDVEEFQEMVEITNPSNTRALFITITSSDPKEATAIANELAEVAGQYISDTMLTDMPTTLSTALEPIEPVSPRKILILAIGFIAAVFIAVWVLLIAFIRDDKIKTGNDLLKYIGASPLAIIPINDKAADKKLKGR
ncbi:MAG: hypothetical protein IKJ65_05925 [Clostridia bacterium]|nr:hypothetical protein [Clostridia bacterium]